VLWRSLFPPSPQPGFPPAAPGSTGTRIFSEAPRPDRPSAARSRSRRHAGGNDRPPSGRRAARRSRDAPPSAQGDFKPRRPTVVAQRGLRPAVRTRRAWCHATRRQRPLRHSGRGLHHPGNRKLCPVSRPGRVSGRWLGSWARQPGAPQRDQERARLRSPVPPSTWSIAWPAVLRHPTDEYRDCRRTRRTHVEPIFDLVTELHPYNAPNITAVPLIGRNPA
jgi:hypothetical protein